MARTALRSDLSNLSPMSSAVDGKMPQVASQQIMADSHRPLIIITWGDRPTRSKQRDTESRKAKPADSQRNFNAGILDCKSNDKVRSSNLRTQTGMNQQLREAVVGSAPAKVDRFVAQVVQAVEKQDLSCISISCQLGRHRSVSLANYLVQTYYPRGKAVHSELNNRTFGPLAIRETHPPTNNKQRDSNSGAVSPESEFDQGMR